MADFLVGHELNEEAILGVDTCSIEVLCRELGQAVVEEVELNIFLIQAQVLSLGELQSYNVKL